MKKKWKVPELEMLEVKMTMKGQIGGGSFDSKDSGDSGDSSDSSDWGIGES